MSDLVLRPLASDDAEAFQRILDALTTPTNFLHDYTEGMSVSRYREVLAERERGANLPPDRVRSTCLFAFVGPSIVGRAAIRHSLNTLLSLEGGHIGFVVLPEFRRRGYATTILRFAIEFAREELNIQPILVTCDDDNVGSISVIERNGGTLENTVAAHGREKLIRRYWL